METSKFSINRIYLLIRRQLTINSKNLIIAFSACLGVLVIINYLTIYFGGRVESDLIISLSFVIMFIGGYIFTSMGFNELHSPHKSYQYLMLPATTLEKIVSVWFLTSLTYTIVSLVLMVILVVLSNLFALLVGSIPVSFGMLLNYPIFKLIWVFLVTQSIFLLGSCYFRKNNFMKTLLALFIIGFILGIFGVINGFILFGSEFHGIDSNELNGGMNVFMQETFPVIIRFIFNFLLAPFFYVVSYFTLKERQV
jgi:hypothetical protein